MFSSRNRVGEPSTENLGFSVFVFKASRNLCFKPELQPLGKKLIEPERSKIQETERMANGTILLGHSLFVHKDMAHQATEIGGDSLGPDGEFGNYEQGKMT